ncbi:MAG: hypothetical protein QM754_02180 [Tepidisphaeraceae bacterium]
MSRKRYPVYHKTFLDFTTAGFEIVEEIAADRTTRLRKASDARRREILHLFRSSAPSERITAVTKAFRFASAKKPLPINFDVHFVTGKVNQIERYSLNDVGFPNHLSKHGRLVANTTAIRLAVKRASNIAPNFVHQVRFR